MENKVSIDKKTFIKSEMIEDLYIYLDFNSNKVNLFLNDEILIKINLIKLALKNKLIKSQKDFWKRIIDIKIANIKNINNEKNIEILFIF